MYEVLLIEDNEADIHITSDVLKEISPEIHIQVARDGQEAIETLQTLAKEENSNIPSLVLLDINIPKRNGFEVLSFIKENNLLAVIPVVMLTTSSFQKDRQMAFDKKADGFITKSIDWLEFENDIRNVIDLWMTRRKKSDNHK